MSNIDKQALRDIAEKTKIAGEAPVMPFEQRINALNDFMKHFTPATALAMLDELEHYKSREERVTKLVLDNSASWDELYKKLEAAEERYEDMLRQARSFREAHDSASELIRKLERNKPVVKLPTTKLWAGKVACYEASEIIALLSAAGIRIDGED
ncbi:ead/Ea22-like family protein [Citrobacter koseri]|uniref:ead/Ea22-like family protein n=1 Tax=Citrobacter koseri TaxID=545 RepID=UPI00294208A5|nr:ead/Ea22-like family protein [Citrobacter koseri]WOJ32679.1 ead/Ea22-like family protein [Citrobacter koseri]WOJ36852.1 ead/Ea22-like family protein [Citrobacter koseri]